MKLSLLRLESASVSSDKHDPVYNFSQKLSNKKHVFIVDSATHQDFSYLPALVNTSGNCKYKEVYKKNLPGVVQRELKRTIKRK